MEQPVRRRIIVSALLLSGLNVLLAGILGWRDVMVMGKAWYGAAWLQHGAQGLAGFFLGVAVFVAAGFPRRRGTANRK